MEVIDIAKYMFPNFKWEQITVLYFKSVPAFFAMEIFQPDVYKHILRKDIIFVWIPVIK